MSSKAFKPMALSIQANVPVVVIGAPGTAKTSLINALGEAMDAHVECVILSLREPSDVAGLPVVHDGAVTLAPPAWLTRLINNKRKRGLLFFDELSTATPATQAAALRVILDRVVGDTPLPANVAIVAAMNPPEQSAGGWELSPPLANRFAHIQWGLNHSEWIDGMIQGFPEPSFPHLPMGWEGHIPQARTFVASFIQTKPTALLQVPTDASAQGKPWPSPRSWYMASCLLAACNAAGVGIDLKGPLIGGCVGEGLALEFLNWLDKMDLPNPEDLLKNPDSYTVPERGDIAYTIMASVASAVLQNMTKDRYVAAWQIFGTSARAGKKDVAVAAVRALAIAAQEKGYLSDAKAREKVANDVKPFTEILRAAGIKRDN